MKKFLAVFDGYKMSKSTMDYAIQLTKIANAKLVGVFLDEFIYRSYNAYKIVASYKNYESVIKELDAKDKEKRDEAVQLFQKTCETQDIDFSIHRDESIALQELKHESMFADLVIINKNETFSIEAETPPTRFMRDLLVEVQSPVLVVPNVFKPIDKIVLLYDGRPSALHAVKMFSYLFGQLQDLSVEVYTVKDYSLTTLKLPDNNFMREFIERHFQKVTYSVNKGQAEEQVLAHLSNHKENELVVLGSNRRSELSQLFKTNMAEVLMKELENPLFITHNK